MLTTTAFAVIFLLKSSVAVDTKIFAIINETIEEGQCRNHLNAYAESLQNRNYWAIQMLDASSKIQNGILYGNLEDLGNFDECLSVKSERGNITGKYCVGFLSVVIDATYENGTTDVLNDVLELRRSICIPNTCSGSDAAKLLPKILSTHFGIENSTATFDERECQNSTYRELSPVAIITITFLTLWTSIVICSTVYHFYFNCRNSDQNRTPNQVVLAFSIISNGKQLFSSRTDQMSCLNGIRVLSFLWIAVFHNFIARDVISSVYSKQLIQWVLSGDSRFTIAGRLGVDSFLTLAGLLISYNFVKSTNDGKPFSIIKHYVHRIVRIWPAMAAVIVCHVFLSKYLVTGPNYPRFVESIEESCYDEWYLDLLFIQNCLSNHKVTHMCQPYMWYLAADMQLYLISPFLLLPMRRYPKVGTLWIILLIAISMSSTFAIAFINNMNAMYSAFAENGVVFSSMYYSRTYTRASPWLIGLLCGFLLVKLKNSSYKPNKMLIGFLWILSLTLMTFVVYYPAAIQGTNYRLESSLYFTFAMPIWSLCLCWVVIACVFGYGGFVNTVLSNSFFAFLAKLTFCWYLLHVQISIMIKESSRSSLLLTIPYQIYIYFGELIVSLFAVFILMFLFEYPPIALEKLFWRKEDNSTKHNKNNGADEANKF